MKALIAIVVAAVATGGCATKGHVKREVGGVNQKVDQVSADVEMTQERVQRNETRIEDVDKSSQKALAKAEEAERSAKGKLVYSVTLSNDKVRFPTDRAQLSDEAKALVDEAIAELKTQNKGVFFEIEGHTDSTGPEELNQKLGEERARAVRDYLHDEHGIALNRMAVISYGERKPVSDNKTAQARAQNRRVVIEVLE